MKMHLPLPLLMIVATSCVALEPADDGRQAEEAARQADIASGSPQLPVSPPSEEPQPGDLAPCPGINPDIRRPAGSNCLGITLDQCGADKAQSYAGVKGTPRVRQELEQLTSTAENGSFRWIPHDTPVIQDLRADRFNVELDTAGVIAKIDCY